VSVATAVISALEGIPVKQNLAMTGSLSVRGEVLPVGGITSKVHAAVRAGFTEVIIPRSNLADIVLSKKELNGITILPVSTLKEVLDHAFERGKKTDSFIKELGKLIEFTVSGTIDKITKDPFKGF
jgi:Lon-like ATP-dependent protease